MLAKDSELPSDEEELAAQLKQAYHDQQALDEKEQIKRLKERFIQVQVVCSNTGGVDKTVQLCLMCGREMWMCQNN